MFQDGYVFGFSWEGHVLEGRFRGEARWSGKQLMTDLVTHADFRRSYFTAAISGDYTFPNSLSLHTELLYNGDGAIWRPRLLVDVLNVFSRKKAVQMDEQHYGTADAKGNQLETNTNYGAPIQFQPPMSVGLGMEVDF